MIQQLLVSHFPSIGKFPALKEEIAKVGMVKTFQKGDILMREGSHIQAIPLLIDGLVKVFNEDEEGNEVLLYYIKKGESCIMSVTTCIRNEKSLIKAVVEETSDILLIPSDQSNHLARKYPYWNEFMYELFNAKYLELLEVIHVLTFSHKDVRLLEYLKKEASLKNTHIIKSTHQKIADELGSSREVISRLLKKLEKEHQLKLSHGTIELLNLS